MAREYTIHMYRKSARVPEGYHIISVVERMNTEAPFTNIKIWKAYDSLPNADQNATSFLIKSKDVSDFVSTMNQIERNIEEKFAKAIALRYSGEEDSLKKYSLKDLLEAIRKEEKSKRSFAVHILDTAPGYVTM